MSSFNSAYRGEVRKIFWRTKYIAFLIIGVAICLIWAGLGSLLSGVAVRVAGMPINIMPTPMGVFPLFAQTLIPLLIFMGASDLLTAESAVMKAIIGRPVERWKLYLGKILAIMSYVTVYLATIFALSAILGASRMAGTSELAGALLAYVLTLLPLMVLTLFAGLVALFGRSPALTMLVLIGSYILMRILPIAFPIFGELLFSSYIGWYRIWIGVRPSAVRLVHMFSIVAGYGIVFFTAGSLVFERKEY